MSPQSPPPFYISLIFKTLGVTTLAFVLSIILEAPFTASTSAIFSNPENNDFTLPDIYAQIANSRPVRKLDDRIAIVDIGIGGREEIAEVLEILALCDPKAVGLDIHFEEERENDERLLEAISLHPNIVLPLGIKDQNGKFEIEDKPFFYDHLAGITYGVVNLPTASSKSNVRDYAVDFELTDGSKQDSFVTALARKTDYQAVAELLARGNKVETTAYHSKEFNIYTAETLADHAEELAGKIVLVGSLSDAADMHSTPINSYMPGLIIHATALSTLLDKEWFTKLPRTTDYLIAFIICFLIVFALVGIKNGVRGLVVRIMQIILAYLAVRLGYTLFVDKHIICNFSSTLLMIAFGLFAFDVWNGLSMIFSKLLTMLKNKIQYRNKKHLII